MSITDLLQRSGLFADLRPEQLQRIVGLGRDVVYNDGDVVIREGDPSSDIYVICGGMVEVEVSGGAPPDATQPATLSTIVRLGQGQVFGEMALVDEGSRSATVTCVADDTSLFVIPRHELWNLCDQDHDIGYLVMRNIASDLSFKLRHRNLQVGLTGGDL